MANSPWAANGLTKEEYAQGIVELEAAEAKHNNDQEPLKLSNTQLEIGMNQTQLIFPDFDYIIQENNAHEVQSNYTINLFNDAAMKSSRFKKTQKSFKASMISIQKPELAIFSPPKARKKRSPLRLGAGKANIRAL